MKGVGGITAVRRRIDQGLDHFLKFDDRAGPAVGDDERQRRGIFRAHMEEVDAQPVDLAGELVKAIELGLARAPIICIGPVLTDILNPSQRRALAPVIDQLRIRPARALQSRFEIGKHIVADIDAERLDHCLPPISMRPAPHGGPHCTPSVQLVSYANGISALVLETLVLSHHYYRAGGHRQGITDGACHIVFRPNA